MVACSKMMVERFQECRVAKLREMCEDIALLDVHCAHACIIAFTSFAAAWLSK
jgi:hypothetical protein